MTPIAQIFFYLEAIALDEFIALGIGRHGISFPVLEEKPIVSGKVCFELTDVLSSIVVLDSDPRSGISFFHEGRQQF